jgi:regulatory protein
VNSEAFQKARDYALLLLKFRLRSERELFCRLKQKRFDPRVIKEAISFLKDKGFLDDAEFARSWISSRAKKPLGPRRLRQELRLKGVDKEIVDTELSRLNQDYPQQEIVARIARTRFEKLRGLEPDKAKRRIYEYFLRRGFSIDVIQDALEQL